MKNILVSGASGVVGYGILRSLKQTKERYNLIGTTIYDDSAAQGFCDIFEKAVPTSDPHYLDWLLRIIEKHKIDLMIPGIEVDLYKWTEEVSTIEKQGAKVLLNNLDLIYLCRDKWVFYEKFLGSNLPYVIDTSLTTDFDTIAGKFGLPFLLKPRMGYAGRGIVRINDNETFSFHKKHIGSKLMVQPVVGNENEEYTTSAFCDGNGSFFASMTMKRKLSHDGFTEKAEVVEVKEIHDALISLCSFFNPLGPTNFQFRMHHGTLKLLEINPRISSSTSIRKAFGYNECEMAINYFLENKKITQPQIKEGRAVRYLEDMIFYK